MARSLNMKFVVLKGTAGFGDRLQCLLQAIFYAKVTGRYLVVDWRDFEWATGPLDCFDAFMVLEGVNTLSVADFLKLYTANQNDLSVHPRVWSYQMAEVDHKARVYRELFTGPNHGQMFHDIANCNQADFLEDVVVYCGTGFRGFRYSDFASIRLRPWVELRIKQYLTENQLQYKQYNLVHLRAGSKKWAGGVVPLQDLAQKIDSTFPTMEGYLDSVWNTYQTEVQESARKLPLVLTSDSLELAKQWHARFKCGQFLGHSLESKVIGSGIHEAKEADLKRVGISRTQVNYECLRDFAVMLNASQVVGDGISLFSKMATKCANDANDSWRV